MGILAGGEGIMEKRVLDEATKAALIGIAPFSCNSRVNFTPDIFQNIGIENQFIPVFVIRGLSVDEGKKLDSLMTDAQDLKTDVFNERAFELTRNTIVDWRNVFDAGSGEEIAFIAESGACSASCFNALSVNVKNALFFQVMKIRGLTPAAKLGLMSSPRSIPA